MAKTPIARERERIRKYVKRKIEKGYSFPDFALDLIKTRSLEELRLMDKDFLIDIAVYKKPTGEVISGRERQAEERRESARKGAETKRRKKDEKTGGDGDYFDTSTLKAVEQRIAQLPSLTGGWSFKLKIWLEFNVDTYKDIFFRIMDDAMFETSVFAYNSYLKTKESEISQNCDVIIQDSDGDEIKHSLDTLAMLLNYNSPVDGRTQEDLNDALENSFE